MYKILSNLMQKTTKKLNKTEAASSSFQCCLQWASYYLWYWACRN